MSEVNVGSPVPDFSVPATGGRVLRLSDFKHTNFLVLYFYPKDSTPGCTREGQDFRDQIAAFQRLNTVIVGVSRDSLRSHERFKTAQCFPFELLADEDRILCRQYGVLKGKSMYGKKVLGIERSTFLIDGRGMLRREWRNVKVEGHVQEVLKAVQELLKLSP
jgi:thioredoxin-dependent peroxiredoxin